MSWYKFDVPLDPFHCAKCEKILEDEKENTLISFLVQNSPFASSKSFFLKTI